MTMSTYHEQTLHNVMEEAIAQRDLWTEFAEPLDKTISPGEFFNVQAQTYTRVIDHILEKRSQGVPAIHILRTIMKAINRILHLLDHGELTPGLSWSEREGEYMALDKIREVIEERQQALQNNKEMAKP